MTNVRMANGNRYSADESADEVVGKVLKAKKAGLPLIYIHEANSDPLRKIWLNPDQISEIKVVENA